MLEEDQSINLQLRGRPIVWIDADGRHVIQRSCFKQSGKIRKIRLGEASAINMGCRVTQSDSRSSYLEEDRVSLGSTGDQKLGLFRSFQIS